MDTPLIQGKLLLGIEPFEESEEISYYKVHLINLCDKAFRFKYDFKLNGNVEISHDEIIEEDASFFLNAFELDHLNDVPELQLRFFEEETGDLLLEKGIRLRAKDVVKEMHTLPLSLGTGFLIPLHRFEAPAEDKQIRLEDVDVDRLKKGMMEKKTSSDKHRLKVHDSARIVDLHAEAFIKDLEGLSKAEILPLQLDHFQKSLEKAITDGIPKLIVIHGVGKGKLRESIFELLSHYEDIKSFENSHDHRFGFGATEIVF